MAAAQTTAVTRRVHKRAVDPAAGDGPSVAAVRREAEVLSRQLGPEVVRLLAHGERPLPWIETADAGSRTLALPPADPATRVAVLAAAAEAIARLHAAGWAHGALEPAHVIWSVGPEESEGAPPPGPDPASARATLCSLGSAVHPCSPGERRADRVALAEMLAASTVGPGGSQLPHEIRSAISALGGELRSGDLDHAGAAASALAALAESMVHERGDDGRRSTTPSQPGGRDHNATPADRPEARPLFRRPATRRRRRLAIGSLLALAGLGVLAVGLTRNTSPDPAPDRIAAPRCAQPRVPQPRADVEGDGCGTPVGYHSGVLTVGSTRWSLGRDVVDGRLVDLDADGWSELAALREDGEVFLVRRFPSDAAGPVRVRSLATVPDAVALAPADSLGSSGLGPGSGLGARTADGDVTTVVEPTAAGSP
ncbi:MAG: hypothetical protein R2754_15930 [Microthrixaceae bacterium]